MEKTAISYQLDKMMYHLLRLYKQHDLTPDMRNIEDTRDHTAPPPPQVNVDANGTDWYKVADKTRAQLARTYTRQDMVHKFLGDNLKKFPRGFFLNPTPGVDHVILFHDGGYELARVTAVNESSWKVFVFKTKKEIYLHPDTARYVFIPGDG